MNKSKFILLFILVFFSGYFLGKKNNQKKIVQTESKNIDNTRLKSCDCESSNSKPLETSKTKSSIQEIVKTHLKEKLSIPTDRLDNEDLSENKVTVIDQDIEWYNKETNIDNLVTSLETHNFLKSVEIKDFFKELKTTKSLSSEQIRFLNGIFWGKITLESGPDKEWEVEMEFDAEKSNDKVLGNVVITMLKNGTPFSRTREDGEIKKINSFGSNENVVLIDAYGGEGYFQLYPGKRANVLIGNYYKKVSVGNFEKSGTISLEKR